MDPTTLLAQLTTALTQVITDESTLQSAITAVEGVVTAPSVDPNDAIVQGFISVLETAGLVEAVPAPVTTTPVVVTVTPAPVTTTPDVSATPSQ
jgi:hypothetical protein